MCSSPTSTIPTARFTSRASAPRRSSNNLEPGDRIQVEYLVGVAVRVTRVVPTVDAARTRLAPFDPHGPQLDRASFGVSPFRGAASIASTAAIPSTTRPNAVYDPSSAVDVPVQMKNDVVALAGSSPRAIETMPFTCFVSLNSGCRLCTSFCCFSVSGAGAARERAGLDDESWRDAMERHAVVDAGLRQPQELTDVFRRLVGEELDRDRSRAGVEHRAVGAKLRAVSVENGSGGGVSRIVTCLISTRSVATPLSSTGVSEIFCTTSMPSDDVAEHRVLPVERG